MEYQKIKNLLDTTSENNPRFSTKKCIEIHDQSCSAEDRYKPSKELKFENQCYYQIYVIIVMHTLL